MSGSNRPCVFNLISSVLRDPSLSHYRNELTLLTGGLKGRVKGTSTRGSPGHSQVKDLRRYTGLNLLWVPGGVESCPLYTGTTVPLSWVGEGTGPRTWGIDSGETLESPVVLTIGASPEVGGP